MILLNRIKIAALCFVALAATMMWSCGNILNEDEYHIDSIEGTPDHSAQLAFGDLSIDDVLDKDEIKYVTFFFDNDLVHLDYNVNLKTPTVRYFSDTVTLNLTDFDKSQLINASLKIKTVNQFPLSADMQFYLVDKKFNVLDSLLLPDQTTLIKNSVIDSAGELVSEGNVDALIPLSKAKIEKIFMADKLIIKTRLNALVDSNGKYPNVKFISSYKLNLKIGLQAKAKIKVTL